MKIKEVLHNKYFNFGLVALLYLLWVIWLDNYWWLLGEIVIFDMYITRKVNWTFWKRRDGQNSKLVEWLDALIFAVIAVSFINIFFFQNYKIPTGSMEKTLLIGDHLFVSKLSYGPRLPMTPLSFPFTQHTMPLVGGKSYVEWIKRPYRRLKGFGEVQRNDIVVFNFPAGDTVVLENQATSYYAIVRSIAMEMKHRDAAHHDSLPFEHYYAKAREIVWKRYHVVVRPVDKEDNYVKRCVAVGGDTVEVRHGDLYINGEKVPEFPGQQYRYVILTNGTPLNPRTLEKMGIYRSDIYREGTNRYLIPLTQKNVERIRSFAIVKGVWRWEESDSGKYDYNIFPHSPDYPWNVDNLGPLWVPEKGATVKLTLQNLPLYRRIIEAYEHNTLKVQDSTIYINGEPATSYTFRYNYYWMMGDNRHASADSRYWGFVPETHIVGKPKYIWLSLNKEKRFPANIRLRRMFRKIQ